MQQSGGGGLSSANQLNARPVHILHGHENVVTSVVINTELDVALSSSNVSFILFIIILMK